MELLKAVAFWAGILFALPYAYRILFFIIGFFHTRVFPPAKKQHSYGIVIAARNEERVIGHLLDSIRNQDYPAELLQVFVVADNCTDHTAQVARRHGAICYERYDNEHRTKGFALQFLFEHIAKDYGTDCYDGFFIFDADNLLAPDYISRMNDAFDSGEKIVTSYRNTKNFGENWLACSYGLHWLGTARNEHRARSFLGLSTRLQGTGYLFDSALVRNGWHYTSLTEDRQLTADAVRLGMRVSYQHAAQFFDEQPTSLRIALRQRLRWSRGNLEVFLRNCIPLQKELLRRCFLPCKKQVRPDDFHRLRDAFICYDIFMTIFPEALPYALLELFKLGIAVAILIQSGITPATVGAFFAGRGQTILVNYATTVLLPLYVMMTEFRRIPHMSVPARVFGILLWPVFPLIGNITMVLAVFRKVEWKPIPHHGYTDLSRKKQNETYLKKEHALHHSTGKDHVH